MADVPASVRGSAGRWLPGVSGNPRGGKPKEKTVSREIERRLRQRVRTPDGRSMSRRQVIADVLVEMAEQGDAAALRLLLSYSDGLPVQRIIDETPDTGAQSAVLIGIVMKVLVRFPEAKVALLDALRPRTSGGEGDAVTDGL